jgi:hypothetical protein
VLANVGAPFDLIFAGRQRPGGLELDVENVLVGLGPFERPFGAVGADEAKPGHMNISYEVDDHGRWELLEDVTLGRHRRVISTLRVRLPRPKQQQASQQHCRPYHPCYPHPLLALLASGQPRQNDHAHENLIA